MPPAKAEAKKAAAPAAAPTAGAKAAAASDRLARLYQRLAVARGRVAQAEMLYGEERASSEHGWGVRSAGSLAATARNESASRPSSPRAPLSSPPLPLAGVL